jgi:hypothetical protein
MDPSESLGWDTARSGWGIPRLCHDPYVIGQQYGGAGPVWMVLGDRGDPSRGTSVLGTPKLPAGLPPRTCGSWHRATRGPSPSGECALTVGEPVDSAGCQRVPPSSSRQHRTPTAPTGGGFRRGRSGSPVLGATGSRSTARRSARRLSSICSRRAGPERGGAVSWSRRVPDGTGHAVFHREGA